MTSTIMKLTKVQQNAVDDILEQFKINHEYKKQENQNKYDLDKEKIIQFQAPTGSGKTFMMANFIKRLILNYPNEKFVFVIATLSSADLPKQMKENLDEYKRYLGNYFESKVIESPSKNRIVAKDKSYEIHAQQNNVFIFGKSSFGKDRILTERGEIQKFTSSAINDGFKIIYIRDEAHYGSKKTSLKKDETKFENIIQNNAYFVIKMTATPNGDEKLIYISEKDLKEDNIQLIKDEKKFNFGIDEFEKDKVIDSFDILEKAIEKFKEIKQKYLKNIKVKDINPAMLIQVSDKTKNNEEEFEQNINKIIEILDKRNLNWVKYFSNEKIDSKLREKITLKSISQDSSDVDVIIFKVGPAVGWNIPRVTMLVKLRNVCSESLSVQTLGRIKRIPLPEKQHEQGSIVREYYVYSNLNIDEEFEIKFKIKNEVKDIKFFIGNLKFKEKKETKILKDYELLNEIQFIINSEKFNQRFLKALRKNLENYHESINKSKDGFRFLIGDLKNYEQDNKDIRKISDDKLYNKIDLRFFLLEQWAKTKKIFYGNIKEEINNWLKFFIDQNFKKDENISIDFGWYVLFKDFKNQFKEIEKKLEKNEYKEVVEYQIFRSKNLPEFYSEIFLEKSKNKIDFNAKNYAYEQITKKDKNQKDDEIQLQLESKNETSFLEEIKRIFKQKHKKEIEIWSKNIPHQGIGFDYIHNDEKHTSFPDFIIRYKEHIYYIEVKGSEEHDINKDKTKSILKAYKNYVRDFLEYKKEKLKGGFSLLICRVDDQQIFFEGASTNKKINDLLKEDEKRLDKYEKNEIEKFFEI